VFGLSLLLALAATVLPTGSRPAAQQTATVRGRVVIDIPPSSRRPSSAYPSRAVAPAQLAPPTEVENVVVYPWVIGYKYNPFNQQPWQYLDIDLSHPKKTVE